jgi:hypothetical protein
LQKVLKFFLPDIAVIEEGNQRPGRKSEIHHSVIQCKDLKLHYAQHDKNEDREQQPCEDHGDK